MKEEPASESAAAVVPTASRSSRFLRDWLAAAAISSPTPAISSVVGGGGGGKWRTGISAGTAGGSRWLCWVLGLG